MAKFRVTLETEIAKPLQYIGREDLPTTKALENEIVKDRIGLDIVEALRQYGANAKVIQVRKVNHVID